MQIQGLIATAWNPWNLEWIRRAPVAMVLLTPHAIPGSVHLNWDKMIRDTARALAGRGCRPRVKSRRAAYVTGTE